MSNLDAMIRFELTERGYKYVTKTNVAIRPELVKPEIYGHHRSFVVDGERHWGFMSKFGMKHFKEACSNGSFRQKAVEVNG